MQNTVLTSKAFFYSFLGQLFIQAIKLVPTRSNVCMEHSRETDNIVEKQCMAGLVASRAPQRDARLVRSPSGLFKLQIPRLYSDTQVRISASGNVNLNKHPVDHDTL